MLDKQIKLMKKWDERFLVLAEHIAGWSRDPSTKCGAVITKGKFIISVGFNGFPSGCSDNEELYRNRQRKLLRVLHAEQNALLSAKRDLTGCTIYVYPFTPCSQCAAAIIQAGITKVVTKQASKELAERWGEHITESLRMFGEAGVAYREINYERV